MTERKEPQKIAPEFSNMDQFNAEINDVGYARYNYKELLEREKRLANMIEGAQDVALFNSGAAAMHSVIEAEGLKMGDVVLCANAIYGTSKADIRQLTNLGIKVIFFNSTDNEQIKELVQKERPRLIVFESIANSKQMEASDLSAVGKIADEANASYKEQFAPGSILGRYLETKQGLKNLDESVRSGILSALDEYRVGQNPFVFREVIRSMEGQSGMDRKTAIYELSKIVRKLLKDSREQLSLVIDNTLPSPHLVNPLKVLKDIKTKKVVVESGTKHYQQGVNEITLGLAYSDSAEKVTAIKSRRIELGTYLQPADEQKVPENITQTMAETMQNHARNALQLARLISGMPGFDVSHPNLPEHKQSELVNTLAPKGAVTLFYITVPEGMTGEQFMQSVKNMAGDRIGLGSSFGHTKTWLSNYGLDKKTVRIAAGSESETDFQKILEIFNQLNK